MARGFQKKSIFRAAAAKAATPDKESDHTFIIQCPQCQARFALPESSLSGIEDPRFHCSRCDSIFDAAEAGWSPEESTLGSQSTEDIKNDTDSSAKPYSKTVSSEKESGAEMFCATEDEVSSDDSFDPFAESDIKGGKSQQYAPTSSLKFHDVTKWTTGWEEEEGSATPSERTVPKTEVSEINPVAKTVSQQESPFFSTSRQNSEEVEDATLLPMTEETEEYGNLKDAKQISFEFADTATPKERSKSLFSFDKSPEKHPFEASRENSESRFYREPATVIQENPLQTNAITKYPWLTPALITAPMILLLLILALPDFLGFHSMLKPLLPQPTPPPPAGLIISDLQMKQVALQSGEVVHLISGSLQNNTEKSFADITIEGLAFDASGRKVTSQKVNANSTLAKTRIESFTPAMIKELQEKSVARKYELEPGSSQDFAIGLFDKNIDAANFYSARIYAAQ